MSKIKLLNPQEGEVVKVKFKPINDIISDSGKDWRMCEDYYGFSENTHAYIKGGHFLVSECMDPEDDQHKNDPFFTVKNHLDANYSLHVHESAIESVEEVEAAEVFVSNDMRMIAVRLDHEMFINGHPMIWDEQKYLENDEDWTNHNRKLVAMFESFITDLAVRDAFNKP